MDTIQWDVFNNKFKELDNVFKERSIKFNNTYTQIPFTYPSFTSLLTSLSPLRTGITNNSSVEVNNNTTTLPKILKQHGYSINAYITNRFINNSLIDTNIGNSIKRYDALGIWKTDRKDYNDFIGGSTRVLSDKSKEPYFLWVHLMDPHYPYFGNTNATCSDINCKELNLQLIDSLINKEKPFLDAEIRILILRIENQLWKIATNSTKRMFLSLFQNQQHN